MRKIILLSICSGAAGLPATWLTESFTFGAYAAEAERRGITHASLVESASFPELALTSLPWGAGAVHAAAMALPASLPQASA